MSFDKNANSVLTMIAITNSEQNFGANVLSRVDLLEEIIKEYNIEESGYHSFKQTRCNIN